MSGVSVSSDLFRRAAGCFATGITVVTVEHEPGRVHGMTANSFTSVSLDPLLVLVCVDQKALLLSYLKRRRRFGISILKDTQEAFSQYFAKPEQDAAQRSRLGIRFGWTPTRIPFLEGALAYLACQVVAEHTAGDHTIFVGKVESLDLGEGEPLVYHRGRYRRLRP